MIKLYVLFVVSWLVVGTIAMETKMGAWHNPFDCPLSYDSLSVLGGSDKKMLKQRRRADRIVRVRENRAKAVAHRKKSMKAAWGVAPKKQETDGESSELSCSK
jgi:hypothetical protein